MLITDTFLKCVSAQNLSYKYTEIKKPPEGGKNILNIKTCLLKFVPE